MTGRLVRLAAGAVLGLAVLACGSGDGSPDATASGPSDGPIVVTFEVADEERFRILLIEPDDIAIARRLQAGEDAPSIPNGLVVRGETGVNEGYGWSIDPTDVDFADVTIEVCDGLPSDVEAGIVTSDRYCPWSAVVVDVQPVP